MSSAMKWTIAIVTLLAGNLLMMVVLAVAANREDRQVIPDYYAQATRYDETMAEAARSYQLGWSTSAQLANGKLEVRVLDAQGVALDGAQVTVSGYQRAHASGRYTVTLAPAGEGRYESALAGAHVGVHDLAIVVERGAERFTQQHVVEAR
jgi:nitrogen fixation protein FixH